MTYSPKVQKQNVPPSVAEINKARKQLASELKGFKTSTGIVMQGVSFHSSQRMLERGITPKMVKDTVGKDNASYSGNSTNPDCVCYQKNFIVCIVSPQGNLVSVIDKRNQEVN